MSEDTVTAAACTLGGADLRAQVERWQTLMRGAAFRREVVDDGLVLRFPSAPEVVRELDALVAQERECCAWAQWVLHEDDGEVVLQVRATADGIAVLHGMLGGAA